MPVQKGKRRNRHKRRPVGYYDDNGAVPAQPARVAARPARRNRWELPWWLNLVWGVMLIGFGIAYFVIPAHGAPKGSNLIWLLLYFALGGAILGKGIRQYQLRRQARKLL